jgi:hypothetical protein
MVSGAYLSHYLGNNQWNDVPAQILPCFTRTHDDTKMERTMGAPAVGEDAAHKKENGLRAEMGRIFEG